MNIFASVVLMIVTLIFIIIAERFTSHLQTENRILLTLFAALVIFILLLFSNLSMFDDGYKQGQIDAVNGIVLIEQNIIEVAKNGVIIESDTTYHINTEDFSERFQRRHFITNNAPK